MGSCCSKKNLVKTEYYKILRKKMKLSIDSIFPDNINYIVKKKKFDKTRENNEIIRDSDNLWKTYLLDNISESIFDFNDNKNWKVSLYKFIEENKFYNQYLFQNGIFYQEIILSKPKTSNKKDNKDGGDDSKDEIEFHFLETEPIFSSLDEDELRSLSKDGAYSTKKIGDNTSFFGVNSRIKENETSEFTISLTMESVNEENNNLELTEKYNSYMRKKYLKIIRTDLERDQHPLKEIINKFIQLINGEIRFVVQNMNENEDDPKKCHHFGLEIVKEIRNFIEIMQVALKLFYSKSIKFKNFEGEKDEIINLISYIIFNDKVFYKNMKNLFFYMNIQKIKILDTTFKQNKKITPKDLGVSPKYCLDKTSEEFWENYQKGIINDSNSSDKSQGINSTNEETINTDKKKKLKKCIDESASDVFTEGNKQKIEMYRSWTCVNKGGDVDLNERIENDYEPSLGKLKKINVKEKLINDFEKTYLPKFPDIVSDRESNASLLSSEPYYMAIYYLSQIDTFQVPLEKLIMISFLSVIIVESVDKFWESRINDFPPDYFSIGADDIMTIYLYIICKLGSKSIITQLDFIKYFTTTITKQSFFGYYYSTFEGCIRYLEKEEKDSIRLSENGIL